MTAIRFPVIEPTYEFTEGNDFRVPLLCEISLRIGWTLRLFIDPNA